MVPTTSFPLCGFCHSKRHSTASEYNTRGIKISPPGSATPMVLIMLDIWQSPFAEWHLTRHHREPPAMQWRPQGPNENHPPSKVSTGLSPNIAKCIAHCIHLQDVQ
eukprot:343135-Amphidinium_carterae.2